MKDVIILRGCSGSGKSSLCSAIKSFDAWGLAAVCSADKFFMHGGEYRFDATKLFEAHQYCQRKFLEALTDPEIMVVIVDNTNVLPEHFLFYDEAATKAGAKVHHVVVENRHGKKNIHDVPESTLARQHARLKGTIKLA